MSKTKRTTKVATFHGFVADFGDEVAYGYTSAGEVMRDGGDVLVDTTCGLVSWTNGFSEAVPGDRVILRKAAPRSCGDMPWVMTGRA